MIRSHLAYILAGVCMVACHARTAQAQAPAVVSDEIREFDVLIKDKVSGRSTVRIVDSADGSTVVATDASVVLSFVVYTYRYEFHGREKWQQNHLLLVDTRAVDDGKQLGVRARVDPTSSTVEAREQPARTGPVLAMTTNYWCLPNTDTTAAGDMSILEADTGKIHRVRLQRVGPDSITVQNIVVPCTHYRLVGDVAAELWYDGQNRLVRQQTVEDGYPTEARLARITRQATPALTRSNTNTTPRY
jgi:hypothetical protein